MLRTSALPLTHYRSIEKRWLGSRERRTGDNERVRTRQQGSSMEKRLGKRKSEKSTNEVVSSGCRGEDEEEEEEEEEDENNHRSQLNDFDDDDSPDPSPPMMMITMSRPSLK